MPQGQTTFSLLSIRNKIIAAVLLGVLAMVLSWSITQKGFREILGTVETVSTPNEKLRTVNSLFQSISQLDQLQRAHANRAPIKSRSLLREKRKHLHLTLDSLRTYCAGNAPQLRLLDSLETKLRKREQLYTGYVTLRADLTRNEALSRRISAISRVISKSKPQVDSTVVTASKKITTTTILPSDTQVAGSAPKPKGSFLSRLFRGRKGEELPAALKQVEEELEVHVDTLSVARQDSVIWKVEKMMRRVEKEHHQRTNLLLSREMEWISASSQLHAQLLSILRAIEKEEVAAMLQNNQAAKGVVNGSISRINRIMVLFSLGSLLLVFLIFLDLARSNRYRKALILAKEEAEQLSQVKQQFLANMSHEIRTPLQTILGFSEQVRTQENPSRKALEAIYQSSEHLLHIVNEVLDYSRIVSGKFTFEQRPFDVRQLVTEVVDSMQITAQQHMLALKLDYQVAGPQTYMGDAFRLRQILYNLIGNGLKFTQAGGVFVTVSAKEAQNGADFLFQVKDTGPGIPADKLECIFQSFEQADATVGRTHGGTGLGLSIVKALAEGQDGSVAVRSVVGEGSVFQVCLPMAKVTQDIPLPVNQFIMEVTTSFKPGKVLVVDDDAFILQLCGAILRKNNIHYTCTLDAAAVLQQDWDEEIALVLLDIRMPTMNGLDLCRALRQKTAPNLKIYALTAEALPEEHEAILAQGFDGFLMKPFREQELMALVNSTRSIFSAIESDESELDVELDLGPLRAMLGHDEEALKAVLEQFISETGQDLEELSQAISLAYPAEARELVHRLAGRTGQLGARNLSAQLRSLEASLVKSKSDAHHLQQMHQLIGEVARLREAIEEKVTGMEVLVEG